MKNCSAPPPVSKLARAIVMGACALSPFASFAQSPVTNIAGQKSDASANAGSPADDQQTLYTLGVLIARNLEDFQLTPEEFERVKVGINDGFNKRADQVNLTIDSPKVQALRHVRLARVLKKREQDGQSYLDRLAAEPKARKTASGLVLVPVKAGGGAVPGKDDEVSVNYQGKLIDGTVFDANKGGPAKFRLDSVIACWSEALQMMKVGEKARIACPPDLAYGLRGLPPKIVSESTLDFDVELVGITANPAAAKASHVE